VLRSVAHGFLVLCSVIAGLVLCEAALTWSGAQRPDPPLYPGDRLPAQGIQADPYIGWRMPPGATVRAASVYDPSLTYFADSLGFRRGLTDPPARAARRIALIGDSFTFGVGVEYDETFGARLERDLPDTRSYNFGMTGFGLDQMWRTLDRYGRRVAPNLVVLAFVDDDLRRSLTAYRRRETQGRDGNVWWWKPTYRLAGDSLASETPADRPSGLPGYLERHSRLVQLWRRASWALSMKFAEGPPWKVNEAILRAVRDECRAAGATLVAVRIPEKGQRRASTAIGRAMARQDIPFLDLGAALPPHPEQYYFSDDPHLNAEGHRWVARELEAFLAGRHLLPRAPAARGTQN
jgi:hypothetical protein